ncbi:MAG: Asp-tRNA(Asn)/Glu-tRNA(Gln) amidotransferase subunit GatB [Clostridiales bacterium]|jgi:aspartyl-tRNA(Asn)/glutamyl-tRNA(Gln) amidotransferase subunit B|nr:Asp-tRNA(Asn)/Glu-tRNA(Gln) amidotransferase subunit GatB [Clostridiales bacterium]
MNWEVVIGLEIHVELATKTKLFCSCRNLFGGEPNSRCCPVCFGFPGTLPVINEKAVEFAVTAGLALDCEINLNNKFDRKNYFYPDLPKAYQISQLYLPFAQNGKVKINVGQEKIIRIHEIHIEEDAGKLNHSPFGGESYPDYNRCGVPLIEIVSEPDMRSAQEAVAYIGKIKSVLEYLGVSDCKMEQGSMRADVNLSVRKFGDEKFGTRTEMKNLNSLRSIERAIEAEAKRQIEEIESGNQVIQQTRRWDDNKGVSFPMRGKENAHDYRYFPEPDLPPIRLTEEYLNALKASMPEFADVRKARYMNILPEKDAEIISSRRDFADLFDASVKITDNPKETANFIIGALCSILPEINGSAAEIRPESFSAIINLIISGKISRRDSISLLKEIAAQPSLDVAETAQKFIIETDSDAVRAVLQKVIAENPKTVLEYKAGKTKVASFFVGQAMKELKGKAKPDEILPIIVQLIGE